MVNNNKLVPKQIGSFLVGDGAIGFGAIIYKQGGNTNLCGYIKKLRNYRTNKMCGVLTKWFTSCYCLSVSTSVLLFNFR